MPATPDENDVPDLFTDSAGHSDEEILANSRMQVGLVVGTGVLVIVITTLVVVLMGHTGQSIADGPNRPVGLPSQLPQLPTHTPAATPSAQPTESPLPARSVTETPSQTKKPPTTPPPPTTAGPPVAILASLSCPSTIYIGQVLTCTITLSRAADAVLPVMTSSSNTAAVTVEGASIALGDVSTSFEIKGQSLGESGVVTATWNGSSVSSETITVVLLA